MNCKGGRGRGAGRCAKGKHASILGEGNIFRFGRWALHPGSKNIGDGLIKWLHLKKKKTQKTNCGCTCPLINRSMSKYCQIKVKVIVGHVQTYDVIVIGHMIISIVIIFILKRKPIAEDSWPNFCHARKVWTEIPCYPLVKTRILV